MTILLNKLKDYSGQRNEHILFSPSIASEMHCNKHVVKMILETAQMLSTAHRVIDGDEYADAMGLYKMAHKNHPSTIWTRTMDQYTCGT